MKTAFELAASVDWAIDETALRNILAIASRENELPEGVLAKDGKPLENSHRVDMLDGVAVIPILGPIFPRANLFSRISGATSIDILAQDFNRALEDRSVSSIVLNIDSPGGQMSGTNEFAEMVFAARELGEKPIVAYVSGMAASAAYFIASAAGDIVIDETALLGSIGVILSVLDTRERDKKLGIEEIEIVSSASPLKHADPKTDEGYAELRARVDELAEVFIAKVARNRVVTVEAVINDFGRGGVLVGRHAVEAGLADRLGSLESVLAELAGEASSSRRMIGANEGTKTMTKDKNGLPAAEDQPGNTDASQGEPIPGAIESFAPLTAEAVSALNPHIAEEFRAEGAAAERDRLTGLDEIAHAGHEALIAKFKADGKTTPAEAALEILKASKASGGKLLEDIKAGAPDAVEDMPAPTPAPDAAPGGYDEAALTEKWKATPALHAEFNGRLEAYLGYHKAVASGAVVQLRAVPAAAV